MLAMLCGKNARQCQTYLVDLNHDDPLPFTAHVRQSPIRFLGGNHTRGNIGRCFS